MRCCGKENRAQVVTGQCPCDRTGDVPPRRAACTGSLMVILGLLPFCGGCLNPALFNQASGALFPTAPGDEPFLAVRVINDTTATLDVPIMYDDGLTYLSPLPPNPTFLITDLTPEVRETGVVLRWPVLRVALGDLDNPVLPAIVARLPEGQTAGAPFGHRALEVGVDYDRGDTIIFYINEDSRSAAVLTVSIGVIDGAAQGQPSRADPFEATRLLLEAGGF